MQELAHQEGCPFVLLSSLAELILQRDVVSVESLVLLLGLLELLLNLLQLELQEVDHFLVNDVLVVSDRVALLVFYVLTVLLHHGGVLLGKGVALGLQLLGLVFELLDDFLAEVRPLGQLFLHFLVDLDVSLRLLNLLRQLLVLLQQILGLPALVLQLGGQLVVLENSESSRSL